MLLAVKIDDADLLRCALGPLGRSTGLAGAQVAAVGSGVFQGNDVLLSRRPGSLGPVDVLSMAQGTSDGLLLATLDEPPAGRHFSEEAIPPLRHRQWLFAASGERATATPGLGRAFEALPDWLRRLGAAGDLAELAFLHFLGELHRAGGLQGPAADPAAAAEALRSAARAISTLPGGADLGLVALGGRSLVALRRERPLAQRLIRGLDGCEDCGLPAGAPESSPIGRAHRRLRGIAVTDAPLDGGGWVALPEQTIFSVDRSLEPRLEPL